MTEPILVVPRRALDPRVARERAVVAAGGWEEAARLLGLGEARWLVRAEAEGDPAWKQVIPYVTLLDPGGRVLVYPRQGRERRLHDLWSLGIGGHVDRGDAEEPVPCPALLERAARREVAEEYPCRWLGDLEVVGLINEDMTEVGSVHVGVCCRLRVDPSAAGPGDGELDGHRWADPRDPCRGLPEGARFELWSELAWELHRPAPGPAPAERSGHKRWNART